jgi:hypothetical protein
MSDVKKNPKAPKKKKKIGERRGKTLNHQLGRSSISASSE